MTKAHRWEWCGTCDGYMVVCGVCGMNQCSGGSGSSEVPDCKCEEAYTLMASGVNRPADPPPEFIAKKRAEHKAWTRQWAGLQPGDKGQEHCSLEVDCECMTCEKAVSGLDGLVAQLD